jgi:nitroreductase
MEFAEVVAKRRMVRRYLDKPVDEDFLRRALSHATRAPSAGFTQGWSFLVLRTPADVDAFWDSTRPEVEESRSNVTKPNPWLDGMRTAPVVIVVLASESAYRSRYSETDKDGASRRAADMPWWQIDAAMASLLVLQTATDQGLGACFFGVPAAGLASLRDAFAIPEDFAPVGAITLGHPAPGAPSGSPTRRARRPLSEVAHDGRWGSRFGEPL